MNTKNIPAMNANPHPFIPRPPPPNFRLTKESKRCQMKSWHREPSRNPHVLTPAPSPPRPSCPHLSLSLLRGKPFLGCQRPTPPRSLGLWHRKHRLSAGSRWGGGNGGGFLDTSVYKPDLIGFFAVLPETDTVIIVTEYLRRCLYTYTHTQ